MPPSTRSIKAKYSIDLGKVKKTKDWHQITFDTNGLNLPVWRHALRERYQFEYKPPELSSTWVDHQKDHTKTLSLTHPLAADFPPELFKSVLELSLHGKKLLKISVYYTTGKILVQGQACVDWVKEEFDKLRSVVNLLLPNCSKPGVMADQRTLLPPGATMCAQIATADVTDAITLQRHEHEAGSVSLATGDNSQDGNTNGTTESTDNEEPECARGSAAITTDNIDTSGSTSDVTPSTASDQCDRNSDGRPPLASSSSAINPSSSRHQLDTAKKLTELGHVVDGLSAAISSQHDTAMCAVHDLQKEVRELVRIEIRDLRAEFHQQLELLCCRVKSLEAENKRLKSQLGEHNKSINSLRITSQPAKKQTTDTHTDDTQLSVNPGPTHSASRPQQSTTANKSPVGMASPLSTQSPCLIQSPSNPPPSQLASNSGRASYRDVVIATVPVSNRFAALSPTDGQAAERNKDAAMVEPPSSNSRTGPDHRPKLNQHQDCPSPAAVLTKERIWPGVPAVLIGDSVLREVGSKIVSPTIPLQKICVPGMSVADLMTWLGAQPPAPHIILAMLHVGINTCKRRQVTSVDTWAELLELMKNKFPCATIKLSSVLPAFGQHPANNTIIPSNRNLMAACDQARAAYIDNTPVFLSRRGAPRKMLYRLNDNFHPSTEGASRLAFNLKSAARATLQPMQPDPALQPGLPPTLCDDPPHYKPSMPPQGRFLRNGLLPAEPSFRVPLLPTPHYPPQTMANQQQCPISYPVAPPGYPVDWRAAFPHPPVAPGHGSYDYVTCHETLV